MRTYQGIARLGVHQNTAYTTATAGAVATTVPLGVEKIRVMVTTDSCIRTDGTTATTNDVYLPALSPEYFLVTQGQNVSAIGFNSAGTLHVTWVS